MTVAHTQEWTHLGSFFRDSLRQNGHRGKQKAAVLRPHRSSNKQTLSSPSTELLSRSRVLSDPGHWLRSCRFLSRAYKVLPFRSCQYEELRLGKVTHCHSSCPGVWLLCSGLCIFAPYSNPPPFSLLHLDVVLKMGLECVELTHPELAMEKRVALSSCLCLLSPGLKTLITGPEFPVTILNLCLHIFWATWLLKWCLVPQ